MKLSYESYGYKYLIETPHDEVTMEELYPLIQQLLLGAGFAQETVDKYFGEE